MTLKTLLRTAAGIAALSVAGIGGAIAANPETSVAYATIEAAIGIVEQANLRFGSILPGTMESQVEVNGGTGVRSVVSGDATLLGSGEQRGQYDFSGVAGEDFTITLHPSLAEEFSCDDPGSLLKLKDLTHNAGPTPLLNAPGVRVGGRLKVPAATVPGSYNCSYTVEAVYNP